MDTFAVGEDGYILRLGGPSGSPNDKVFAAGVTREKCEGAKHLNGVARTAIVGEEEERFLAVGDDGRIGTRRPAPFIGVETGRWTWRSDVTSKHLRGAIARSNKSWIAVSDGQFLVTSDAGASWGKRGGTRLRAVC